MSIDLSTIDLTVLPTRDLIVRITEFAQLGAREVAAELQLRSTIKELEEARQTAEVQKTLTIARATLDQLVCARREDTAFVLRMIEEFNSRPDREMTIPEEKVAQLRPLATF